VQQSTQAGVLWLLEGMALWLVFCRTWISCSCGRAVRFCVYVSLPAAACPDCSRHSCTLDGRATTVPEPCASSDSVCTLLDWWADRHCSLKC
jgi:hypothetical protein